MRELIVSVTMAKRAVAEPMLISERRLVTTKETITAFSGMFQPGVTYFGQFICPSAVKGHLHIQRTRKRGDRDRVQRTKAGGRR